MIAASANEYKDLFNIQNISIFMFFQLLYIAPVLLLDKTSKLQYIYEIEKVIIIFNYFINILLVSIISVKIFI